MSPSSTIPIATMFQLFSIQINGADFAQQILYANNGMALVLTDGNKFKKSEYTIQFHIVHCS